MPTSSSRPSEFVVPADLGPNDAHDVHEALLGWLKSKRSRGKVDVSDGSQEVSISALQLVIAATRSEIEKPPALGPRAEAAVASFATPKILEQLHS